MIFTSTPKRIRVMFTPFRDGLQSSFGGKVRLECGSARPAALEIAFEPGRPAVAAAALAVGRSNLAWTRAPPVPVK